MRGREVKSFYLRVESICSFVYRILRGAVELPISYCVSISKTLLLVRGVVHNIDKVSLCMIRLVDNRGC